MTTEWLAAAYHFPSTYSCRVPMSSMNSALAMPAPGPATVRLALIRKGVELFGLKTTREEVFPSVRAASILISPPERVTISQQLLRSQKWEVDKQRKRERIQESLMLREVAHAQGCMTVFLHVRSAEEHQYQALLRAIGYWGQTDSLTSCLSVTRVEPDKAVCAVPLRTLGSNRPVQPFFSCLVTEFRDAHLRWEEVVPSQKRAPAQALRLDVFVWPMVVVKHLGGGKLLVRSSLASTKGEARESQ